MLRIAVAVLVGLLGLAGVYLGMTVDSSTAGHSSDEHSENMQLIANYADGDNRDGDPNDRYRNGTDMAFWGNIALLGKLDQGTAPVATPQPGGFRVMDISNPRRPRELGQWDCYGDQSDVSLWKDIAIVSVDKPKQQGCENASGEWEGIRVVSIKNRAKPELLAELATDCGSHTNTIYPDVENGRLLVYVLSYPLAGRYNPATAFDTCNAVSHRKFTVVEVPLDDPSKPRILGTPTTGETIGCHDVTVFLERKLAAAACLTESQMWDLSNPAEPKIVAKIRDPRINIHHSTVFSNDGRTLVLGDELGGAAASPGCLTGDQRDTYGGLFFYDVTGDKARAPEPRGAYKLPQRRVSEFCTAHLFNVVPRSDDKDVLVSSWYTGATSVIDFTDPSKPTQIAYYIPRETTTPDRQTTEAAAWSSYWYNGAIYSNNFDEDVNSLRPRSRGLDVFTVDHPLTTRGVVRLPRLNPQVQEPFGRAARAGSG